MTFSFPFFRRGKEFFCRVGKPERKRFFSRGERGTFSGCREAVSGWTDEPRGCPRTGQRAARCPGVWAVSGRRGARKWRIRRTRKKTGCFRGKRFGDGDGSAVRDRRSASGVGERAFRAACCRFGIVSGNSRETDRFFPGSTCRSGWSVRIRFSVKCR